VAADDGCFDEGTLRASASSPQTTGVARLHGVVSVLAANVIEIYRSTTGDFDITRGREVDIHRVAHD
jgi:hypothetical protein